MSGSKQKYPGLDPLPPDFAAEFPPIAQVAEVECIACDRCPPLCFFDALVMENRAGHPYGRTAVVISANCTGCGLCFEACPVDAIRWVKGASGQAGATPQKEQARRVDKRESY
jgi:formate hydrogenlyase subunit 6/NADH:ubiquinone oxidoreductase subunit I